jgi:hypothetical protein
MIRSRVLRCAIVLAVVLLAGSSPMNAQAQRTFVSAATGNDANPCTRALPCRGFGAAIAATATDGEVIVLDSGGYGPVSISQAVTLFAPSGVYAGVTAFSGTAISVSPGPTDVVRIAGLALNSLGATNGINATAGILFVENCSFDRFTSLSLRFSGSNLQVEDSVFRSTFDGIQVLAGKASINRSRFEGFSNLGVYVNGAVAAVRDSVAANGHTAYYAHTGGDLTIEDSAAFNNGNQGASVNGGTLRLSNTILTRNTTGVVVFGGGTAYSFGNNRIHGNGTNVFGALTPVAQQ